MDLVQRLVAALGVDDVEELLGGHQSRVFRVTRRDGAPAVAKVLDASMVDRRELDVRLEIVAALAELDPRVCAPLLIDGERVTEMTSADGRRQHHVTCFELAAGTQPDPARADDAARMGTALAELHASMSQLPAASLPVVHALRTAPAADDDDASTAGSHQMLHGDFNATNLRQSGGVMRIFDLDDCGCGPPAFDVANALYMVLFDAATQGSIETYERFRRAFVDSYISASGASLDEATLDRFIALRVRALASWLDDLDDAPIGIRTASPTWHATLHAFVTSQGSTTGRPGWMPMGQERFGRA